MINKVNDFFAKNLQILRSLDNPILFKFRHLMV